MLHRLKTFAMSQMALDAEIAELISQLQSCLGSSLIDVYLFGSAARSVATMHPNSDIDLCVVVDASVNIKDLYGKLPISKQVPVDWIIVSQADFDAKVAQKHGVYAVIHKRDADSRCIKITLSRCWLSQSIDSASDLLETDFDTDGGVLGVHIEFWTAGIDLGASHFDLFGSGFLHA